ncbi:MAG: hypothetical protein K2H18_07230, partial [Muribaculaceae bacterium]|nr:hypothetical protein [Muribaculaceae bacterium]
MSNHRYWRQVTKVVNDAYTDENGNHYGYINLSKLFCESGSDVPMAGDEICQLGYMGAGNKERQTAMVFSTVDAAAPSVKLFSGINSFSLDDKAVISFGRDPNTGKIFFRLGNSTATQYLEYKQDSGLVGAGSISSQSTYDGKILGDYIEDKVTTAAKETFLVEYSADKTNWHPNYQSGDLWMRVSSDGGENWNDAMPIVGANYTPNLLKSSNVKLNYLYYQIGRYKWDSRPLVGTECTLTICACVGDKDDNIEIYQNDGYDYIGTFSSKNETIKTYNFKVKDNASSPSIDIAFYHKPNDGNFDTGTYVKWAVVTLGDVIVNAWIPSASEMVGKDGQYRKWQWGVNTSATSAADIPENKWSDTPLTAKPGEYVWMRSGTVTPPATNPDSWEAATRLTGDRGEKGDSVYKLDLTDEVKGIACDASGNPIPSSIPTSQASVFKGSEKVTSGVKYSVAQATGINAKVNESTGLVSLTALTADTASVVVQAVVDGVTLQSTISVYKVIPGKTGANYAPNLLVGTKDGFLVTDYIATGDWGNYKSVKFEEGTTFAVGDKIAISAEYIRQLAGNATQYNIILYRRKKGTTSLTDMIAPIASITRENPKTVLTVNSLCDAEYEPILLIYSGINGQLKGTQTQYGRIMAVRGDKYMDWAPAASEMIGKDGEAAVVYSIEPSVSNITKSMTGELSKATLICSVYKTTGNSERVLTGEMQLDYRKIKKDGTETTGTLGHANGVSGPVVINDDTEAVIFELYTNGSAYKTLLDSERVPVLSDASDLEASSRNLLLDSEEFILEAGTDSNFVKSFKLPVALKKGDCIALSVEDIQNITGSASEYQVNCYKPGLAASITDGSKILTASSKTAVLKITTDEANPLFVFWAGKQWSTANNTVKYIKAILVKGNVPMQTWVAAPEDMEVGVRNLLRESSSIVIDNSSNNVYSHAERAVTLKMEKGKSYIFTIGSVLNYSGSAVNSGTMHIAIVNSDGTSVLMDLKMDVAKKVLKFKPTVDIPAKSLVRFYVGDPSTGSMLSPIKLNLGAVMLVQGTVVPTGWIPAPEDVTEAIKKSDYLQEAFKENTKIEGGVTITTIVLLGRNNTSVDFQETWAGLNGIYMPTAVGGGIAAFYGGDMEDLAEYYTWSDSEGRWNPKSGVTIPSRIAKGLDRMDGSGYRAGGNFWWDADDNVYARNLHASGVFTGQMTVGDANGQRIELDPMQRVMNIFDSSGKCVAIHSGRILKVKDAQPK